MVSSSCDLYDYSPKYDRTNKQTKGWLTPSLYCRLLVFILDKQNTYRMSQKYCNMGQVKILLD